MPGNTITYLFDETGTRYGFKLTNTAGTNTYWYTFNGQGDVISLVDKTGTVMAKYTYDAWGKPLTVTDGADNDISANASHPANLNPIRYRGYYYDGETGLFYVGSRYYDPETGRFLNADSQIAGVGGDILGYNMFAYCFNNPVNMSDSTGEWPFFAITAAIGAVVGAVAGGVVAAANGKSILAGVAIGAAAGALIGTGVGMAAGMALAGSITATTGAVMAGGSALVATVSAGGLGAGATYVANNISQAVSKAAPAVQAGASKASNTYYQITSKTGATQIAETQKLKPIESSFNYVLNFQPTLAQAQNTGARALDTVVRFSTNYTGFVRDATCAVNGAFVANTPGVIKVFEVVEVGFR